MNRDFSKISLGERDLYIRKLEEEIKNKKGLLLKETRDIDKVKTGNKLLEGVHKNYKTYYNGVVKEKQQQYDAMMLLKEYLDDLIKKEQITSRQFKNVRNDQKDIVLEMDKITKDLKEIVKG